MALVKLVATLQASHADQNGDTKIPVTVVDERSEFGTLGEALAHYSRLGAWLQTFPTPDDPPQVPFPTEESLLRIVDKEKIDERGLPEVEIEPWDPHLRFQL